MDILLSTVIQLTRNVAPVANTLCEQSLTKKANGAYVLQTGRQLLNAPQIGAATGDIIGASTVDAPRNLTLTQVSVVQALHKDGVCATPDKMP
jgi:hypothetical protein